MRFLVGIGLIVVGVIIADVIYWRVSDREAVSRDTVAAFSDQCARMAADFNAVYSEAVRARAYEQNLGMLKTHPLTGAAQCTQVRCRCEIGYSAIGDSASSWQSGARFVERGMHRCIFPLTTLGGMGGPRQVELLE